MLCSYEMVSGCRRSALPPYFILEHGGDKLNPVRTVLVCLALESERQTNSSVDLNRFRDITFFILVLRQSLRLRVWSRI
jgi:hypothetical protein